MNAEYAPIPSERLLALDPMTWGFGFAVLEYEPIRLVGWGTKTCRRKDGSALAAVNKLILDYQPTAIVMPDWRETDHEFRGPALEEFIDAIGEALTSPTLPVLLCTPDQVRSQFAARGAATKYEIAKLVSHDFPELQPILPSPRRVAQAERAAMSVFDAVALAATARDHIPGFE
jgi:Holliday junction resolvasome RuvABC endonuclease subunit